MQAKIRRYSVLVKVDNPGAFDSRRIVIPLRLVSELVGADEVSPGIERNRVRTGGVGVCAGTPEALMPEKLDDRFSERLVCVVVKYDTLNDSVDCRNRRTIKLEPCSVARTALPRFVKRRHKIEIAVVGVDGPVHEFPMTDNSDGREWRFIGGSVNPIGARIHRRIPV